MDHAVSPDSAMPAPVNPLTQGTPTSLLPQPCVLVIFGAAGDLAWRKLLPAVYNVNVDGLLPSNFAVVGFGVGSEGDPDQWLKARARDGIEHFSRQKLDEDHWADFGRSIFYVEGRFDDPLAYERLKRKLDEVDVQFGIPGSRIFYMSIPPQLIEVSVNHLKTAGMVHPPEEKASYTRIICEKPIGRDLDSARAINAMVAKVFDESQTYRIDHYLGKETVQNLLVLRFANSIFEPLWNGKYIDHVQITVAEEEGLSQYDADGRMKTSRVGYFEGIGNLRDMVQNHLLQVLCMVAMEPPWSLDPDVVRDAKSVVLRCLRPLKEDEVDESVVRAEYAAGEINGRAVPEYRQEVRDFCERANRPVPDPITTETYVAMRVHIDNWRWSGVPFYLRTGKRLPKRSSEVAITFKAVPSVLFNQHPDVPLEPTVLSLKIQPEEGLSLRISSKLPGPKLRIYPVKMDFNYGTSFGGTTPEAYERLILDVMAGDPTLFMRRDAVEAAWEYVMPILNHWEKQQLDEIPTYQAGTWGPEAADKLIEADDRQWRAL